MTKLSRPVQPLDLKNNPPPVCTVKQGCVTVGVSRATMNRWIKSGRVRSVKLSGGIRRLDTASLAQLIGAV